jgi:hypothetical protein
VELTPEVQAELCFSEPGWLVPPLAKLAQEEFKIVRGVLCDENTQ